MGLSEPRPVTFSSDGLNLEGLLHLPGAGEGLPAGQKGSGDVIRAPGLVVAHPHPQYGGDMHNNVVTALCRAALSAGAAVLRFNFRGVGRSEGAFDSGLGEQRDIAAALDYLRALPEIDAGRLALAGYSFGAAVAVRLGPPDIRALIAVSTPTVGGWLSTPQITCPILFLSGDRDEYSEPDALHHVAASIGQEAEALILHGVDHFWVGSTDRMIESVTAFLQSHLA